MVSVATDLKSAASWIVDDVLGFDLAEEPAAAAPGVAAAAAPESTAATAVNVPKEVAATPTVAPEVAAAPTLTIPEAPAPAPSLQSPASTKPTKKSLSSSFLGANATPIPQGRTGRTTGAFGFDIQSPGTKTLLGQ